MNEHIDQGWETLLKPDTVAAEMNENDGQLSL